MRAGAVAARKVAVELSDAVARVVAVVAVQDQRRPGEGLKRAGLAPTEPALLRAEVKPGAPKGGAAGVGRVRVAVAFG